MKKKYCLIAFILLAACQKGVEPFDDNTDSTGTTTISGTWNFISLNGNTQSIQEYTDDITDYSTTTTSAYTSTNNTGSITFGDSDFTSINIGYLVSSEYISYNYENGVLIDTVHMPFSITIDSSNSTGSYKLIGSDSIYFPGGNLISFNGSQSVQGEPSGGKFSVSGNTLTLTQMINKDTMIDLLGVPIHTKEEGTFVIKLQKQ
jgi:hypothetical protein